MAFTYLILNSVFFVLALALAWRSLRRPTRTWWITLGALLILTFIFDNCMILLGFFHYDTTKLLGLYIGSAPIEDFFYALLAVLIVPALWRRFSTIYPQKPTEEIPRD